MDPDMSRGLMLFLFKDGILARSTVRGEWIDLEIDYTVR